MDTVKLKNGIEEAEPLVQITMLSLQGMFDDVRGVTLFYDLVMRCRDRGSKMWDTQLEELQKRGLLQPDGQPHDSIKNIVLSAAVGSGSDMRLQNPIASYNSKNG